MPVVLIDGPVVATPYRDASLLFEELHRLVQRALVRGEAVSPLLHRFIGELADADRVVRARPTSMSERVRSPRMVPMGTNEAAERLNVSDRTVRRWCDSPKLDAELRNGRWVVWLEAEAAA